MRYLLIIVAVCINISLLVVTKTIAAAKCSGSGESSRQVLEASFKTQTLNNELIVFFKHYYWTNTRQKYLEAALQNFNNSIWQRISRQNAASVYPSDFDLVLFSTHSINRELIVSALKKHPAIKNVSVQRSVERNLKFITADNSSFISRRLLRVVPKQIATAVEANILWEHGIKGQGVKVAVFDTGLARNHPHFRNVKERTNWTNEKSLDDGVSHGTFVAGVIASSRECYGLAPDAELHIYRVFTNNQVSYTSWFLDAFNYAIFKRINILNLSIGGPDFLDHPFVEKVYELSANRVIMVSAIGNDGPQYGTLNNPGDQSDVIGVGGINFEERVAKFSSRGMTTWELPHGYGRLKPDLVTYGSQVSGTNVRAGCRTLSGTSVAAPVIAGAITLLISSVLHKMQLINPASIKQVLLEGATRLPENNMFEQGHGKLNLLRSLQLLLDYQPRVTLSPAYLDFSEPYMWPYSAQPLYCDSSPIIANITIINGHSVIGHVLQPPQWHAYSAQAGELLDVAVSYSSTLWPWSGWFAVHLAVNKRGCDYAGDARGHVSLLVQPDASQPNETTTVLFPIKVHIITKPPRHKRLLWDQYHSLRYPPGYIPRDNLKIKSDPLDWRADHIHTNFRDTFTHLRSRGYYIDVLRQPFTCFNASEYNTLLLFDTEEEFHALEMSKLQHDVYELGLSVIVIADWYNASVMQRIKFFDENTRQWWIPDTGGANIPALNELLQPYGLAFGDTVAEGHYELGEHQMYYASGVNIVRFPQQHAGNILINAHLEDQGRELLNTLSKKSRTAKSMLNILAFVQTKREHRHKYVKEANVGQTAKYEEQQQEQEQDQQQLVHYNDLEWNELQEIVTRENNPILNKRILLQSEAEAETEAGGEQEQEQARVVLRESRGAVDKAQEGRIVVFGDSNCLDSAYLEKPCFWLLDAMLSYTTQAHRSKILLQLNRAATFVSHDEMLPLRLPATNLHKYSKILTLESLECEKIDWQLTIFVNKTAEQVQLPSWHSGKHLAVNKDFLRHIGVNNQQISGEELRTVTNTNNTAFQDTIVQPLAFVCLLTFIVLAIFIHYFKFSRRIRFLKL